MRLLPILAMTLAAAACGPQEKPRANETGTEAEAGPVKGIDRSHKGQAFPKASFLDEEDQPMVYEPLLGTPTLVNLWATWCAPCVKELPKLDKLQKQAKEHIYVATISQDSAPRASVEAFLADHKLDLPIYRDPKMAVAGALGAEVLPTSILYDAKGRELWRYVGDLDWTGPEAAKLLAEASGGRPS